MQTSVKSTTSSAVSPSANVYDKLSNICVLFVSIVKRWLEHTYSISCGYESKMGMEQYVLLP